VLLGVDDGAGVGVPGPEDGAGAAAGNGVLISGESAWELRERLNPGFG